MTPSPIVERPTTELARGVGLPARAPDRWVERLTEPVPEIAVRWRQDGKATKRDGKFYARFVAYVDADTVRERLDLVVPGEWDSTLEVLPIHTLVDKDGTAKGMMFSVKCRLQILGVIRENIGQSDKDWKAAATDAFKRAGHRFGIGHELGGTLYQNIWAEVSDESKYAKLVGDPAKVFAAKRAKLLSSTRGGSENRGGAPAPASPTSSSAGRSSAAAPPARPGLPGVTQAERREARGYGDERSELPF